MYRAILFSILSTLCVTCSSTAFAQQSNESRTWKSDNGHETKATLIEANEKTVRLKLDNGKSVEVPIEKLSKKDQGFLRKLAADKKKAEKAAAEALRNTAAKPVVTDEDLDAMEEVLELSGGASMRNPFGGNSFSSENSSDSNGVKMITLQLVNSQNKNEELNILTLYSKELLSNRPYVLDYWNGSLVKLMESEGWKDISLEKFSKKPRIVDWHLSKGTGTTPDGVKSKMRVYLSFEEQVQLFLVIAEDESRVELLSKAVGTYKLKAEEPGEEAKKVAADDTGEMPTEAKLEFRTWRDFTGKFEIEALLKEESEGKVTLQTRSGKEIELPYKKLSSADQTYLKEIN